MNRFILLFLVPCQNHVAVERPTRNFANGSIPIGKNSHIRKVLLFSHLKPCWRPFSRVDCGQTAGNLSLARSAVLG